MVVAKYEYGQSVNEVNCGHMWGFVEVACYDLLSLGQQAKPWGVSVPGESETVLGGREKHAGDWSVDAQMILLLWHDLSLRVERGKDWAIQFHSATEIK